MITEETIRQAKRIDLPHFFRKKNISLIPTNNGTSYKCKCPFHEDKEPSLNINLKDGVWLWNCFGCRSGGTIIDFVMKYDSIDFKESIKRLIPETTKYPNQIKRRKEEVKVTLDERINLLDIALNHYQKILTNGDTKGKAYLEKRGLLDNDLIKEFKLGFSDGKAKHVLKDHRIDLKDKIGIFDASYYELFSNCVIFPILNENGKPTDFYGRRIIDYKGRVNHCYNKGKHLGIFNYSNVKDADTVILTECIIDALSIYKAGFYNVTSLYGAGGFTKEIENFLKSKSNCVILALDNDKAGGEASFSIASKLNSLKILKTKLPDGINDFNELLIEEGVEAVKTVVFNAVEINTQIKEVVKPEFAIEEEVCVEQKNESSSQFSFKGKNLTYQTDFVCYLVRNVSDLKNLDSLRFIITATYNNQSYSDRIDLYLSRSRKGFESSVSRSFGLQPAIIENDLVDLINFIEKDFEARKTSNEQNPKKTELKEEDKREAIKFLQSPDLIRQILQDITKLGYIGEDANKLLLYLGATSRLLEKAISILIRSQSSSGKSYLIKLVCNLLPSEDVHKWTRATQQALYYMAEDGLKHKFLAIDEREGIEEAEYPIRSLQSEGSITLSVPIKNPTTGATVTEQIVKEGPIAYVDGSTDTRVNPENANRCFEIYLDESEVQTKNIHQAQKREYQLEGLENNFLKKRIKRKHQNAQRLLKPLKVIIPYVKEINFPTDRVRTRRDHDRFLLLISCITFLHQYQRELKVHNEIEYIESTLKDYEIAYKIASVVIFNTFQELEKPVFDFYMTLSQMVEVKAKEQNIKAEEYFFTRRFVRSYTKLPDYLVKRFMRTLSDLEYLDVKGGKQGSRFSYRINRTINEKEKIKGLTTPDELHYKLKNKTYSENKGG